MGSMPSGPFGMLIVLNIIYRYLQLAVFEYYLENNIAKRPSPMIVSKEDDRCNKGE